MRGKSTIAFFYNYTQDKYTCYYFSKLSMNYHLNVNGKKISILLSIFLTGALILAPLGVNTNAFAQGGAANKANSAINQAQSSAQNAQCISGALSGPACNNTSNQGQVNTGGITTGQTATSGGTGMGSSTQSKHFDAKLTGKNEVPPKDTKATGTATFNAIGTDSITYTVHVKDMQMVTASHIHQGTAGQNGPVLVTLFNNPTPSAMTNGELAKGTITATNLEGPLAGKQITDLISMIKSGGTYANVHTTANPMGEIRGQIVEDKAGMGTSGGASNSANSAINQGQSSTQSSNCTGGAISGSCNNTSNQGQSNTGGITTGQAATGGAGGSGSGNAKNTANSAITQAQNSQQNAACLAGTLTGPACNNTSNQGQSNTGGITTGQSATGGK
jgi:hypothetical protein